MREHLLWLLEALDGVMQDTKHHPEGDALYHSLQVFQCAQEETADGALLAAALLHDIGKAIDPLDHAEVGADELEGLLSPRVVWLVRHHMDLLYNPRRTRRLYWGMGRLDDLQRLRQWDLRGRDPNARVMDPEEAIEILMQHPEIQPLLGAFAATHHEESL